MAESLENDDQLQEPANDRADDNINDPSTIAIGDSWYRYLEKNGKQFRKGLRLRDGLTFFIPSPGTVITYFEENEFGVYKATLTLGLRFPCHPFICTICYRYNIGIAQLTPPSWQNILTFIAVCEIKNLALSFYVFLSLHFLNRLSKSEPGVHCWYAIQNGPGFLTAVDKASKVHRWKYEFVFFQYDDLDFVRRMQRWVE